MVCKNCGAYNEDGTLTCISCGAPLESAPAKSEDGNGLAVASLICSIVSFFCCGIITAPLAVIFGIVAKKKGSTSGCATAGIIVGVIGVIVGIISAVSMILMIVSMAEGNYYY